MYIGILNIGTYGQWYQWTVVPMDRGTWTVVPMDIGT